MYSFFLLLFIAIAIVYGALFVRYHEAIAYYGEERIGFHAWIEKLIGRLWSRKKL